MPVLSIVFHLTCIRINWLTASITKLCIHRLETVATKWISFFHNITHASKWTVTFKTTEMVHMPASVFCFCALFSKDDLAKYSKIKERLAQFIACVAGGISGSAVVFWRWSCVKIRSKSNWIPACPNSWVFWIVQQPGIWEFLIGWEAITCWSK